MHVLRLPLETTEYEKQILTRRFYMISHLHNVMVKQAKKRMIQLRYDKNYISAKTEYTELLKKHKFSKEDSVRKKELSKIMSDIRSTYGLSKYSFEAYLKVCGKQFKKHISSQQVQKEADRVWEGVEKILFGNGKELHFKKYRDFSTICGKTNTNGIKFDPDTLNVEYIGLHMKCTVPKKNASYVAESLNHKISYCEIKRLMFPNGWHYYLNIYLDGNAPYKISNVGSPDNTTGIDIGTSTIATASETKLTLKELAPKCKDYNKKICKLLEHLDRSKRTSNPAKYKADGTIDRTNHDKWIFSKTYLKDRDKLKSLYRQKTAYTKQSHEEYANELIRDSVYFIVETMNFRGLAKRSQKTERQDKISVVKQKDGTVKQVHKYKKKKRFGSSMNNRSPALMIQILKHKAEQYGGALVCANTREFRASQYNHIDDIYEKTTLGDRSKIIGGHKVQRDLYSAFLLKNSDDTLNHTDREKCIYSFKKFLTMQIKLIEDMVNNNISMKQCFGF